MKLNVYEEEYTLPKEKQKRGKNARILENSTDKKSQYHINSTQVVGKKKDAKQKLKTTLL